MDEAGLVQGAGAAQHADQSGPEARFVERLARAHVGCPIRSLHMFHSDGAGAAALEQRVEAHEVLMVHRLQRAELLLQARHVARARVRK